MLWYSRRTWCEGRTQWQLSQVSEHRSTETRTAGS